VTTGDRGGPLVVANVYPDLLGTYGDGGNGRIVWRRAQWRGIDSLLVQATSDRPLPEADVYCLGGGEDGPEVRAAETLRSDGTLGRAVERGAVVLGVCAGFQLLGRTFPDAGGRPHVGLGLLDVTTERGKGRRAVGEVVAEVDRSGPVDAAGRSLPPLTGFENHGAVTTLGTGANRLATVVRGVGNGGGDGSEGAWADRVVGTYLHGPVLARNIALADLLLAWALAARGIDGPLAPLEDREEIALRTARLAAARRGSRSGTRRRLRAPA
jgi:lipid II isoglutaminyl synthase (glutamine-hydrolysing)